WRRAFLKHGETSQSLSLSDLLDFEDGIVKPKPKPANPPVRANVLYLSKEYSMPISRLNDQIRGMEAVLSELWYVEELDVALALEGRKKIHKFQVGC
ncbi:hypothetical protein RJ641_014529, partial [Dillenia turbinata]